MSSLAAREPSLVGRELIHFQTSQSRSLVDHLQLFFIHPAAVCFDSRGSDVDLTKIGGRKLNSGRAFDHCQL